VSTFKRNGAVWLAVAIPVVVIAVVALSIYVPRLFVHPATDFVYVLGDTHQGGGGGSDYRVVDGRIAEAPTSTYGPPTRGRLYRYDVKANTAQSLTLEQARRLVVDANLSSPDGFTVAYADGVSNGLFPFDGGNGKAAVYLDGRSVRLKLDIAVGRSYEPDGFRFLAWVR
jgi:hypothetical protein